jgi:hypothetical protein
MLVFNHVSFLGPFTERIYHTNHGLHLNKKGKDWLVNNLVKKIKNLYQPYKTSLPIVLPWRDNNENTIQLAQSNEGSLNETINNNLECQRQSMNTARQITRVNAEFVNGVPSISLDNNAAEIQLRCQRLIRTITCKTAEVDVQSTIDVPLILLNDNKKCQSPRETDDYHMPVKSIVSLDAPSKLDVVCIGKTLIDKDDTQAVNTGGNPIRVSEDSLR